MGSVGSRVNPHAAIGGVVGGREDELPPFKQVGRTEYKIILAEHTDCRRILAQPARGIHDEAIVAGIDHVQLTGGGLRKTVKTELIVLRLPEVTDSLFFCRSALHLLA